MLDGIIHLGIALWQTLEAMAPYLLFGFFVAGLLAAFVPVSLIERHFGGRGWKPVVKAALFGVPLPLCSCGVLPVAASLRRQGAGKGATLAFLISTPQTGVDSILVTYGMMGPIMAVLRPVLALVTGVMGGCLLEAVDRNERESAPADAAGGGAGCALPAQGGRWRQAWRHGAVTLPADIGRPMLAGLLIAGVIAAFVPDDFFTGAMKSQFLSMLVMLAVGIPLYVCASASVPIAAVLILKGLSPGAALVFLIVGPATNAATVTTLWRILGRRATWVYLLTVSVTALLAGLVVNLFAPVISTQVQAACHAHAGGTHMAGAISAVVLIVLLLPGFIKFRRRLPARIPPAATRLRVKGMTCRHCAQTVEAAVRSVPGVATATVSLVEGLVWVEGRADISAVRRAIKAQGYDVAAE
jgi:uncharacterized membrane protein YraQ (UPF0718 family)/copper chaperone CopZ